MPDSGRFCRTIDYFEKRFVGAGSRYRNDVIAQKVFEVELTSKWFGSGKRQRANSKLKLLKQNEVGYPANDFVFIDPGSRHHRLSEDDAEFTLLFFYNPECDACKDMYKALISSAIISCKVKAGALKVLAIYEGDDTVAWKRHIAQTPCEWVQGRDENERLYVDGKYDLRAIPTVYVLDKKRNVLLKDCLFVTEIEGKIADRIGGSATGSQ
jgi:hypothetical protein